MRYLNHRSVTTYAVRPRDGGLAFLVDVYGDADPYLATTSAVRRMGLAGIPYHVSVVTGMTYTHTPWRRKKTTRPATPTVLPPTDAQVEAPGAGGRPGVRVFRTSFDAMQMR